MVGVPEGAACTDGLQPVQREAGETIGATRALERGVDGDRVGVTQGADASVASENLIAEVARVGAETPLVNAVVGTEGTAAFGEDFEVAPAAEWEIVGAARKGVVDSTASTESTGGEHRDSAQNTGAAANAGVVGQVPTGR